MTTLKEKIEILRHKKMDILVSRVECSSPCFMKYVNSLYSFFDEDFINSEGLHLYFEQNIPGKSLLCFRLEDQDSFVVYSAKTKLQNRTLKSYVRLEAADGILGYEIANKIARTVVPFFRELNKEIEDIGYNSGIIHIVDFSKKKIKIYRKPLEKAMVFSPKKNYSKRKEKNNGKSILYQRNFKFIID